VKNNRLIRENNQLFVLVPQEKNGLCFDWALNDFLTVYAPVFNALTNL